VASLAIFDLDCSRAETLASALAPAAKCGVSAGNSDGKVLAAGCEIRAGASDGEALAAAVAGADLLVNATPVGMFPEQEAEPPVETRRLPAGLLVYDLVYNPLRTRLLREAEQRGCRVLSGAEMLVRQGALAFELWTGQPAPVEVMRRALYEALQG
jgi:shikimate dehydrogenase